MSLPRETSDRLAYGLTKQKVVIVDSIDYANGVQELKEYVAKRGLLISDKDARTLYNIELQMKQQTMPLDLNVIKQLISASLIAG